MQGKGGVRIDYEDVEIMLRGLGVYGETFVRGHTNVQVMMCNISMYMVQDGRRYRTLRSL